MRIFNLENVKLTNIKQNHLSNYSKYKDMLLSKKINKNNSVDDIINKIYLEKNNKNRLNSKRTFENENISIPIINSNNFSQENRSKEKKKERHYMNEKNIIRNLLNRFAKIRDRNKMRNFSFTNNLINSKVSQYEESLKNKNNKIFAFSSLQNENNSVLIEKNEGKKIINNYKNNLNKKYNGIFINRNNIKKKENLNDEQNKNKIKKIKNRGFNTFLNKFISENIINNFKSFNKIRHLIKLNGFSLNSIGINNFFIDNDLKEEKEIQSHRIDTQKMIRINRLQNIERFLKNKNDNHNNSKENGKTLKTNKQISRNKILPLIKSEKKENKNKLKISTHLFTNKTESKRFKLYNKEIIIKREVNKFYQNKNYKSFKELFNDIRNDNDYININNIEFFLTKILKISIPLSREEIKNIFFNNLKNDKFDYYAFKKFFNPFDEIIKNDDSIYNDDDDDEKDSNREIKKIENSINSKILESEEILLDKLKKKKGMRSSKNNNKYLLDYKEFYNLVKENLIINKNKYFEFVVKKIFKKNLDLGTKKLNIIKFLFKEKSNAKNNNYIELENKNNNSEFVNEFKNEDEKKKFRSINLRDDAKIKLKNKIFGEDEILNNKVKKQNKYKNLKKVIINNINNRTRMHNLNNFTKSRQFINNSEKNRKNKNSDIINLI